MPRSDRERSLSRAYATVAVSAARSRSVLRSRSVIASVGLATSRATSVSVGSSSGAVVKLVDRGEHHGVFELGEAAFEHGADQRGAHLGAAEDLLVGGFVVGGGSGGEGLMVAVPPGLSFTTVSPRCSARVAYSPLGSAIAVHRPPGPVP